MPALRRTAPRLLKQVNHQPHATQKDHHDVLPTPPATNSTRSSASQSKAVEDDEEIMRDPESSEDEQQVTLELPTAIDGAQDEPPSRPQFKGRDLRGAPVEAETKKVMLKMPTRPTVKSPESMASTRSSEFDDDRGSSDSGDIFGSQGSTKRQKPSYNMHAAPRREKFKYGSKARKPGSSQTSRFKEPNQSKKKVEEPKQPTFQHAKIADDMFRFQGKSQAEFTTPDTTTAEADPANSASPSLSSLSSAPSTPDVEEIKRFQLPAAMPYCAMATCTICGHDIAKRMKEDFEDEFTDGKAMNFKWQQRFCEYHRRKEAEDSWERKGYPVIDWKGLEARLRKHDKHLSDVITDRVKSEWKHDFRRDLRPSRSKAEVRTARAGYYGPRGERVMAEHIAARLSGDLRQRASKDKIVAASGVKGGVSGFVHGVLVPELACRLIAEDMSVDAEEARRVVAESASEGVLLNPDLDEDVAGNGGEVANGD